MLNINDLRRRGGAERKSLIVNDLRRLTFLLDTEDFSGRGGIWTHNQRLKRPLLYHLSYAPERVKPGRISHFPRLKDLRFDHWNHSVESERTEFVPALLNPANDARLFSTSNKGVGDFDSVKI